MKTQTESRFAKSFLKKLGNSAASRTDLPSVVCCGGRGIPDQLMAATISAGYPERLLIDMASIRPHVLAVEAEIKGHLT